MMNDFFHDTSTSINNSINPDEAVAYGAAVQAAVLSGDKSEVIGGLTLLDVTPLTLGTETVGGVMTSLIKRNTSIPTKNTRRFTTIYDNQSSIDVKVNYYSNYDLYSTGTILFGLFCFLT